MCGPPKVVEPVWLTTWRYGLVAFEHFAAELSEVARQDEGCDQGALVAEVAVDELAEVAAVADVARHRIEPLATRVTAAVLGLQPLVIGGEVVRAGQCGAVALLDRCAAPQVGLEEELRHVRPGLCAGDRAAEQRRGVDVGEVGEAPQILDRRGGDRLVAVLRVGHVAGQRQPVALDHLGGE